MPCGWAKKPKKSQKRSDLWSVRGKLPALLKNVSKFWLTLVPCLRLLREEVNVCMCLQLRAAFLVHLCDSPGRNADCRQPSASIHCYSSSNAWRKQPRSQP